MLRAKRPTPTPTTPSLPKHYANVLPSASPAGQLIYIVDEEVLAFSDGSMWIRLKVEDDPPLVDVELDVVSYGYDSVAYHRS